MAVSPDICFPDCFCCAPSRMRSILVIFDKKSRALMSVGKGPLAESYPYITIDSTCCFLLVLFIWRGSPGGEPDRQEGTARRSRSR